jgi:hypothetical protein
MGPRDPTRQADHLRDIAERYLRLASGTDQVTHRALVMYASELLDEAQQIESTTGADEPQVPDLPVPHL